MGRSLLQILISSGLLLASILWLSTRYNNNARPKNNNNHNYFDSTVPQQQRGRSRRLSASGMQVGWKFFNDPRSIVSKDGHSDTTTTPSQPKIKLSIVEPLSICERKAALSSHDKDVQIMQKYFSKCLLTKPPEEVTVLVLDERSARGRTGNNLIEFLHSFQYGEDHDVLVAIKLGSWVTNKFPDMWMAKPDHGIVEWSKLMEEAFCVKMFVDDEELDQYQRTIKMDTGALFRYQTSMPYLDTYIEFQSHIIRTLWRSYNNGVGFTSRNQPAKDMCSVIDAMFGNEKQTAKYSVIHSRTLEGEPGLRLLGRISRNSGCDPVAALNMEPEYIKAILAPLGMLMHPILFITDHQRPEILEKLQADPDIGPNIHLVPDEASWVGGDMTVAVVSTVFIGNPASTFSGFIAKSRVALGYGNNFLFRRKYSAEKWVDVCDGRCMFDKRTMFVMA